MTIEWSRVASVLTAVGPYVSLTGAIVAVVIGLMLMIAFYRATRFSLGGPRQFALAILWITGAYVGRTLYRDIAWWFMSLEAWQQWAMWTAGLSVNVLWSVAFSIGAYHGLRGLELSVLVEDRHRWPWWKAWAYPPFSPIHAFREIACVARANMRRRMRNRR